MGEVSEPCHPQLNLPEFRGLLLKFSGSVILGPGGVEDCVLPKLGMRTTVEKDACRKERRQQWKKCIAREKVLCKWQKYTELPGQNGKKQFLIVRQCGLKKRKLFL